jgi:hypothetical protein
VTKAEQIKLLEDKLDMMTQQRDAFKAALTRQVQITKDTFELANKLVNIALDKE